MPRTDCPICSKPLAEGEHLLQVFTVLGPPTSALIATPQQPAGSIPMGAALAHAGCVLRAHTKGPVVEDSVTLTVTPADVKEAVEG